MDTITRVGELISSGHEQRFVELADSLESKVVLHKDLQEKLDALGNTPIAEPDLYKATREDKITLAKELLTVKQISSFKASEVGDFIYAVEQKITSLKIEDGTFKSTPNTEDCSLPNFLEADELVRTGIKEQKIRTELTGASLVKDNKRVKKLTDELEKNLKRTEARAFEIAGLDPEVLTEWEKLLVTSQIFASAINASLSSVGKRY